MLDILFAVEADLPALVADRGGWTGLHVDYHPPRVDRAWRPWHDGTHRIYLHRIHPCPPGAALFHPHPWPSAMRILSGSYEMALGYGVTEPPFAARVIAGPGTAYEMTAPDAWHFVRPLHGPVLTWMVTGAPWGRTAPKPDRPLPDMTRDELVRLLSEIQPWTAQGLYLTSTPP
jgi:hypothetical protein